MKDEIKEILDKLEQHISIVSIEDEDLLLDYITNLQEENENLKDYLKIMEKGKDNNLNRFLDYKSRNKKAIEMFDDEILNKYYYGMSYEFAIDDFKEDIFKILKGEDNE